MAKTLPANAGDVGLIPGPGRSLGEGNGNPLQYSCLENSMDRGAWWAVAHGVDKTERPNNSNKVDHSCRPAGTRDSRTGAAARQASLSITSSRSLLKPMSIESVMTSNHLTLCLLPPFFPSIRVFSNESARPIRWPKDWSFSFSISPSNEFLGLISFRMDWLDLLAVQGTLKSLLQHHSSEASILLCS